MQRAVFNKHTSSRINFPFKQQDQRLKKKKKKAGFFLQTSDVAETFL